MMSAKSSPMRRAAVAAATALTLVSANLPAAPANAESATRGLSLSTEVEPITKLECISILGESSRTIGTLLIQRQTDRRFRVVPWSDEFPRALARFFAPTNPDAIYKVIINGNFDQKFDPDTPEGLAWSKENIPTITCAGDKNIITPDGLPAVAKLSIEEKLRLRSKPINLAAKGIRFVRPVGRASIRPTSLLSSNGPR